MFVTVTICMNYFKEIKTPERAGRPGVCFRGVVYRAVASFSPGSHGLGGGVVPGTLPSEGGCERGAVEPWRRPHGGPPALSSPAPGVCAPGEERRPLVPTERPSPRRLGQVRGRPTAPSPGAAPRSSVCSSEHETVPGQTRLCPGSCVPGAASGFSAPLPASRASWHTRVFRGSPSSVLLGTRSANTNLRVLGRKRLSFAHTLDKVLARPRIPGEELSCPPSTHGTLSSKAVTLVASMLVSVAAGHPVLSWSACLRVGLFLEVIALHEPADLCLLSYRKFSAILSSLVSRLSPVFSFRNPERWKIQHIKLENSCSN